ncbi:cytochrome P450 [Musa troglodytarum]|uniref:Cytochrome P450 n=2 Tax=Musa troglodytarum TaxID=320322 RepID=A0A9E7HXA9_9LILI|nr:cytochrome P450 [Musa troglodytarum]
MGYLAIVLGTVSVVLISCFWKAFMHLTWRPYVITQAYRKQGVRGPAYRFWSGSLEEIRSIRRAAAELILDTHSHDITTRVLPHFAKWIAEYGETFLFWIGPQPLLCISEQEMIKQVLASKHGSYARTDPSPAAMALVGKGLTNIDGSEWARHRRVVNPAFAMDKLKLFTRTMAECTRSMLEAWQDDADAAADHAKEVEVAREFQELTANVISHTAFGSSYSEGKEVFVAQKELQILVIESFLNVNIPGFRYVPTRRNLRIWNLERRIRNKFMGIIRDRLGRNDDDDHLGCGNDLLGLMLEAATRKQDEQKMCMDEIIDECKTFFIAGHETTSHLLIWAMFLLSTNLQWQEKLREEVLRECGMEIPNADTLANLKLVTMVLLEALRIYSPVALLRRKAAKDVTLGNINIKKNTLLMMPIAVTHRNKEVWGDDANEFNPLRFENGILKAAAHPSAFLSFSIGPRACIGQNFAMLEAKTVIAMILQRFSFSLSHKYKHAPIDSATMLQPQFGVPIVLRPIHL